VYNVVSELPIVLVQLLLLNVTPDLLSLTKLVPALLDKPLTD